MAIHAHEFRKKGEVSWFGAERMGLVDTPERAYPAKLMGRRDSYFSALAAIFTAEGNENASRWDVLEYAGTGALRIPWGSGSITRGQCRSASP
jgi:hypothetical protein